MGRIRLILILALAAILAPTVASAQTTITAELPFRSKYLFAGMEFAAEQVQQAHVAVNTGALTFHGFGVYDVDAGEITERDVYADYWIQASSMVGIYVGGAFYSFKYATGWEGTPELYGGVVLSTILSPTVHVARDFDLGDGTRVNFQVSHSIALGDTGAALTVGASTDYNAEYYTTASGFSYWDTSASLSIPVGPATVTPVFILQRRADAEFRDFIPHAELFGVTASMTFGG